MFDRMLYISIHAPTRGATFYAYILYYYFLNFNPRSHERSDLTIVHKLFTIGDFNPRSHERSDDGCEYILHAYEISIHAPTRGATSSVHVTSIWLFISIHAPTRGATVNDYLNNGFYYISIHAPTRGATVNT